jgi:hypothetical protein
VRREELLDVCRELVTKHRQSQYGTPEDNFGRIAAMWGVYLGVDVRAHDVANMMILLKVVRSQNMPAKSDTWVDVAGYAACGCEVATQNGDGQNAGAPPGAPGEVGHE